jgi:hypothetical protein
MCRDVATVWRTGIAASSNPSTYFVEHVADRAGRRHVVRFVDDAPEFGDRRTASSMLIIRARPAYDSVR